MQHNEEIWKDIPDYKGLYQASTLGNIRSLDRYVRAGPGGVGKTLIKGQLIKPIKFDEHRFVVGLRKEGEHKQFLWHRIIALAFLGPCPEGLEVCHGKKGRLINSVDNLRYDTRQNNIFDAVKDNTHFQSTKTECPRGHKLIEPNLKISDLKKGRRCCLACDRAKGMVIRRKAKGFVVSLDEKTAYSNLSYQEIMGEL